MRVQQLQARVGDVNASALIIFMKDSLWIWMGIEGRLDALAVAMPSRFVSWFCSRGSSVFTHCAAGKHTDRNCASWGDFGPNIQGHRPAARCVPSHLFDDWWVVFHQAGSLFSCPFRSTQDRLPVLCELQLRQQRLSCSSGHGEEGPGGDHERRGASTDGRVACVSLERRRVQ